MGDAHLKNGRAHVGTFPAPVETYFARQLVSNHALHYARAEALTRGRLGERLAGLGPAEDKASVRRERPFDVNPAFRPTEPHIWPRWSPAHPTTPKTFLQTSIRQPTAGILIHPRAGQDAAEVARGVRMALATSTRLRPPLAEEPSQS
jgi:hypothetical protein